MTRRNIEYRCNALCAYLGPSFPLEQMGASNRMYNSFKWYDFRVISDLGCPQDIDIYRRPYRSLLRLPNVGEKTIERWVERAEQDIDILLKAMEGDQ